MNISELEVWDAKICEKAAEFGLSYYPQEFEICDHNQMLGYMAYSGMPSHYPHWSHGKAYEKLKTLYDYGVSGIPYEMVINSNPALAYLMRDNSLALQILTMAHVYGHNDFFKNNFTFRSTNAALTLSSFKARADRVRSYIEDPSIGIEKVESLLDAAHALSLQCRRHLAIKKLTPKEEADRVLEAAKPPHDPFRKIHPPREYVEPDMRQVPLSPDEDILLFIRDYNPHLEEWQKDLLTIVHEAAQYFIPQIDTKIMNEGWASFWHREILNALDLPQGLYFEFLVRHNQVVRPLSKGLNPYHVGISVWDEIFLEYGGEARNEKERSFLERMRNEKDYTPPADAAFYPTPYKKLFAVREEDRDVSFLRRYLSEFLMRELDLFQYELRKEDVVVTKVSDRDDWQEVKRTLLKNVGMGSVPVIKVENADHEGQRMLYVKHDYDGRDLELGYAEKTLEYLYRLWGRGVVLETFINGKKVELAYNDRGFTAKARK